MKIINIALLISVVFLEHCSANHCQESKDLQSMCGLYCFAALQPVLVHTKNFQGQMDALRRKPDYLAKLERSEKLIEQKIDLQGTKIKRNFEMLHNQLRTQFALEESKLENRLNDLLKKLEL